MKKKMAIMMTALTLAFTPAMAANATESGTSAIDETEMLLTFDFYGDNASVKVSRTDDGRYIVTDGGFFATDGAEVAELSVENSNRKLI